LNERERAAGLAVTPGYRYAEAIGKQLFVAGQVPLDGEGRVVAPNDARRQAEQCLTNLVTILGLYGFELRDVRHLRIYVAGEFAMLVDAWTGVRSFFGEDAPPATLLGVRGLGYDGQVVEIEPSVVRE
jgi:enamine deaminase RidA (YjgF/YER057c/UK114 family)